MSIFSRTRDIFAANITEMLDRSEDPAKMIRMVILEMEETLVEVRASAARTIADQKAPFMANTPWSRAAATSGGGEIPAASAVAGASALITAAVAHSAARRTRVNRRTPGRPR